jgi:hypothetical protein
MGRVRSELGVLELPSGYIKGKECDARQPDWVFPEYTPEALAALWGSASLDAGVRRDLDHVTECAADGCRVRPTPEILLAISPESRTVVYETLARYPQNPAQTNPYRRTSGVGPWSEEPGLSAEARGLLQALTYRTVDAWMFADLPVLCARLRTDDERASVLETLMSRTKAVVQLKVSQRDDLEGLVSYWQAGSSPERVRALLQPPADGSEKVVDVVELLPPFARKRVNTFAPLRGTPCTCFYTAVHFFDEQEPERPCADEPDMPALLARDYVPVHFVDRRFGDLVVFATPQGELIHAANYVAADVVFTKNGAAPQRPWVLQNIGAVLDLYRGTQMSLHRRRAPAAAK